MSQENTHRNNQIIKMHILFREMSYAEIGRRFQLSRERVRQIVKRWTLRGKPAIDL